MSPEYKSWHGMKQRCLNPNATGFRAYGGSGIAVCDRWRFGEDGRHPFLCFLADLGPKPSPKHSLDRINCRGNYEPANCKGNAG